MCGCAKQLMEERRGGGEREREMVGRKTQEERGVQRTIYARVPGPHSDGPSPPGML